MRINNPTIFLWRYAFPFAFYWACLIFISLKPADDLPRFEIPYLDKLVHFCFFYGLSLLFGRLLLSGLKISNRTKVALWAFLLGVGYGVIDEFLQSFVPGRVPDPWDYLFDLLGSLAAAFSLGLYLKAREAFHGQTH